MITCASVRERLALFLYGDLPAEEASLVAGHLAGCPSCQKEYAVLEKVRRGLDALPAGGAVVNLPALYNQAMVRRQDQVRRWRRRAIAVSAVAAGLLLFVGLGLRLGVEENQLVIRWGSAPAPKNVPPAPIPPAVEPRQPFPITQAEVQTMRSLVHALAEEADNRDRDQHQALDQLADRLDKLEARLQANWTVTQRLLSLITTTALESEK